MRMVLLAIAVAALSSCVQAPKSQARALDPAEVAAGRALSEKLCARCHAIGATGESPFVGAPPLRTLSERYPIESLDEAFAEGIVVGHPAMPEFQLTPAQIAALTAYLQTIQTCRGG